MGLGRAVGRGTEGGMGIDRGMGDVAIEVEW